MLKAIKRLLLPIFGFWSLVRFFLDNWGRLQELREFFEQRGSIMKWIGLALTSHWLPVMLFVGAVLVLAGIHFDLFPSKRKKNKGLVEPKELQPEAPPHPNRDSQLWTELKATWEEALRLKTEWQNFPNAPPLQKTEQYLARALAFCKENLTFNEIRKIDNPLQPKVYVFEPCLQRFDMVNVLWSKLCNYERHLLDFMRPVTPHPPTNDRQTSVSRVTPSPSHEKLRRAINQLNAQNEIAFKKTTALLDQMGELIKQRKNQTPSVWHIRQNMLGLLIEVGAHRLDRENDLVRVCDRLVAAGNDHPFKHFEGEYSPLVAGEWLEFLKAYHLSGGKADEASAWSFAVQRWRGKDRWLNRPKETKRPSPTPDKEASQP